MTIYTSAALTRQPFDGYCDKGEENTRAQLAKHGLTWESKIPMRLILQEMGLADCVFSFCKVWKGCEAEADVTLRSYMAYMYSMIACEFNPADDELYTAELKAIRKRFEGHNRPILLARAAGAFASGARAEPDPAKRYAWEALRCLASDKPDALAACHAGIAVAEAGRIKYGDNRLHDMLRDHLYALMPEGHT